MKPQKYPKSIIKKGAILYSVSVYTCDDDKSVVDIDEWHVRSIMKKHGTQTRHGFKNNYADNHQEKYVHLTLKIKDVTWVRQSRKINDFGWSKNIYYLYKQKFIVGNSLPSGFYTTLFSAFKYALLEAEDNIKYAEREIKEAEEFELLNEVNSWKEELLDYQRELKQLKSRFTKYKNKKLHD